MGALFNRKWALTVSTFEVDAFAIHFRVEKTIKPEPNKVTIEVWNLNDDHRAALQELAPGKRVGKKAGRKGKTPAVCKDKIINIRRNADALFELEHQSRFWADEIGVDITHQDGQLGRDVERAKMNLGGE